MTVIVGEPIVDVGETTVDLRGLLFDIGELIVDIRGTKC